MLRLSRRAPSAVVLAIAALLLALTATTAEAQAPDAAAVITAVAGAVEVRDAGATAWRPAATGHRVGPGALVRTGPASKAELTHAAGVIRMYQHTVLRLPAERVGNALVVRRPELVAGQSLFDVVPSRIGAFVSRVSAHARSLFEVVTPHVVSGVKGTRFAVIELDGRTVVAVYEGKVEASDAGATPRDTVFLTYGQLAEYREGRLLRVRSFDFRDDWTGWARPAQQRPSFVDPSAGNSAPQLLEKSSTDGGLLDGTTTTLSGTVETLGGTVGGTVGGVVGTVGGTVDSLGGVLADTTTTLTDTTTSLLDTGGALVDDTTGVLTDTTSSTIGTVGGLLGQ